MVAYREFSRFWYIKLQQFLLDFSIIIGGSPAGVRLGRATGQSPLRPAWPDVRRANSQERRAPDLPLALHDRSPRPADADSR